MRRLRPEVVCMQQRGRYHVLATELTMLLRCESLEPPLCQRDRASDATVDQIRIRHQHSNGASAGHRGAARAACNRRRGDRVDFEVTSMRLLIVVALLLTIGACQNPSRIEGTAAVALGLNHGG